MFNLETEAKIISSIIGKHNKLFKKYSVQLYPLVYGLYSINTRSKSRKFSHLAPPLRSELHRELLIYF